MLAIMKFRRLNSAGVTDFSWVTIANMALALGMASVVCIIWVVLIDVWLGRIWLPIIGFCRGDITLFCVSESLDTYLWDFVFSPAFTHRRAAMATTRAVASARPRPIIIILALSTRLGLGAPFSRPRWTLSILWCDRLRISLMGPCKIVWLYRIVLCILRLCLRHFGAKNEKVEISRGTWHVIFIHARSRKIFFLYFKGLVFPFMQRNTLLYLFDSWNKIPLDHNTTYYRSLSKNSDVKPRISHCDSQNLQYKTHPEFWPSHRRIFKTSLYYKTRLILETRRYWSIDIGSGNYLVPSGNKPLPASMSPMWHYRGQLSKAQISWKITFSQLFSSQLAHSKILHEAQLFCSVKNTCIRIKNLVIVAK